MGLLALGRGELLTQGGGVGSVLVDAVEADVDILQVGECRAGLFTLWVAGDEVLVGLDRLFGAPIVVGKHSLLHSP